MGFHTKDISLVGTSTIGPKGQVVIPVEAREQMGVKPGDKLVVLYMKDHKTVSFICEREMQSIINKMGTHLSRVTESLKNIEK